MLVESTSPHEDGKNCMPMGWWRPQGSKHGTVVIRRETNGTEKAQLLCDQPKSVHDILKGLCGHLRVAQHQRED